MLTHLSSNEIHLYSVNPDEIVDPVLISSYHKLLSDQERDRYQAIRFDQHKHQFLVTRALIRNTLSNYIPIKAEDWQFIHNEYGRPEIEAEQNDLNIRFNISHTDGLIICGITLNNDIGVDAESIHRKNDYLAIAERYFSDEEVNQIKQKNGAEQNRIFYQLWTLKEAYIKACGKGLSIPLNRFSMSLKDKSNICIEINDPSCYKSDNWRFWLYEPNSKHQIAVAINASENLDYHLTFKKATIDM